MVGKAVHIKETKCDVYIGRPSKWGNPFVIGKDGDRATVIKKYRQYLWDKVKSGEITLSELAALHNKTLGCFCAPAACHGDVLTKAAAWAHKKLRRKK